jgi:hypothetical protein
VGARLEWKRPSAFAVPIVLPLGVAVRCPCRDHYAGGVVGPLSDQKRSGYPLPVQGACVPLCARVCGTASPPEEEGLMVRRLRSRHQPC